MVTKRKIQLKDYYRPGEMRKLGSRVHFFSPRRRGRELYSTTLKRNQERVATFIKKNGGQVYTGQHSEADWDLVQLWYKGWPIANRTGDYAVVL